MANNLILPNGNMVTIIDNEDFRNLIQETLGTDAIRYLDDLIEEGNAEKYKAESDFYSYEASLDSNRAAFNEILNLTKTLQNLLTDNRLNRAKLSSFVKAIQEEVNEAI